MLLCVKLYAARNPTPSRVRETLFLFQAYLYASPLPSFEYCLLEDNYTRLGGDSLDESLLAYALT